METDGGNATMADPSPSHPPLPRSPSSQSDPEKGSVSDNDQTQRYPEGRQSRVQELLNDPRVWRPLSIAVGPLPVLCFMWIFFAVTFTRPVAVPDYLAPVVRAHSQSTTMIVSIVATILASSASYFFALAVRYVIAIRLATSNTSLDVLTCATRIAQKTLWLHDPRVKWTWIVLAAYVGVSLQTSALTSFLTIREIQVPFTLAGNDLHMGDPQLLQVASQTGLAQAYYQLTSFFYQNAMISALQIERNIPSTFNFNGYTYLGTTGGIQPARYIPTPNVHLTNNTNLTVPPNLQGISSRKHLTLPFNKTMQLTQQGFTADIDCRVRDPQDLATYPSTFLPQGLGTAGNVNLTLVSLAVACPGATQPSTSIPVVFDGANANRGVVLAVACQIPNTSKYDIIIRTIRPYQDLDNTVCTITPKVTVVDVTYYTSAQNLKVPATIMVSKPTSETDVPTWGRMAVDMLLFNVFLGQSVIGSTMGNAWLLTPGAQVNTTLAEAMNTYLKAAVEFTGTVIRQVFTQPDSPYIRGGWTGLADSMRTPIGGTFTPTTYGWLQEHRSSPLFLLPTTVVILATYGLLGYGIMLARIHKDSFQKEDADFDPTDIVHVIAAHSPEARRNEFRTFSDQPAAFIRKTSVKMNSRQGVRALEVVGSARKTTLDGQGDLRQTVAAHDSGTETRNLGN